jgi:hypothetical protein
MSFCAQPWSWGAACTLARTISVLFIHTRTHTHTHTHTQIEIKRGGREACGRHAEREREREEKENAPLCPGPGAETVQSPVCLSVQALGAALAP